LKPKPKRCIVRVARLPDVERSEISVTPASSIMNSDIDEGKRKGLVKLSRGPTVAPRNNPCNT